MNATDFHQSWFLLALAGELGSGQVVGRDFLGTRVILYRDAAVLDTIRFRPRVLVASNRHLARFFKFVREFPRAQPLDA